jgi:hypothetical protein
VRARKPDHAPDPLFYIAGWPGVAATDTGVVYSVNNIFRDINAQRDIVFLDHALAAQEDWTPIVKSYVEQHRSNQPEQQLLMHTVITCFEPGSVFQPDEIARLNPPAIFRDSVVKTPQIMQKICAALPEPDPSLIYGPGESAPLSRLMFNSLLDPIFPPANMEPTLKEFTKSRVVTEPTEVHDTSGSSCRWKIIAQYIQQGSEDGLDISCMEQQKLSFVIGN